MTFDVTVNGRDYRVELEQAETGSWAARVNGEQVAVNAANTAAGVLSVLIGSESYEIVANAAQQQIAIGGVRYSVEVRDPRSWRTRRARAGGQDGAKKITAPMPGKVVRIIAQPGTEVEQGSGVIVIEAMKMQNELKSPKKGMVVKILAAVGASVNAGDVLAVIE
ncbi:MAG TPA: biotin/lipoyl-containing protein [Terriglobales bacterium]|jgi:biotin carboxyl carrier protein|nr:biotin/lipoyl-containing protein [Terriglobales bacterium]